MYDLIGHDEVRSELALWNGPYVIVGPESVGRDGMIHERYLHNQSRPLGGDTSTFPLGGVRNFFVGKLTCQNVSDILKRDYPKVLSRALAASILDGSFQRIKEIESLVEGFEDVTQLLATHSVPRVVTRYIMEATTQACLFRITESGWAFNSLSVHTTIPEFLAQWYLKSEPTEASTIQFYYGVRDGFVD